jgi:hypothetical protein
MKKIARVIVLLGVLSVVALCSFTYLNTRTTIFPGWTVPVKVQDKGSDPLLTYHNGELWLAFFIAGEEGRRIEITRSQDGIEWSPPSTVLRESPEDCSFPLGVQLLERPDGTLWFFSMGLNGDDDCSTRVLYYSILEGNGTWSTPTETYGRDDTYFFSAIANTPDGGVIVLENHTPTRYTTVDGKEVPLMYGNECFVQPTDETLELYTHVLLDTTQYSMCKDILLDHTGVLWMLYRDHGGASRAYVQTSEDGISWSYPQNIPIGSFLTGRLIQRQNHQFVLIFRDVADLLFMTTSLDCQTWSEPTLVASVMGNDNWINDFDVTEADDSTLWVIIESRRGFFITQYSDKQYVQDIHTLRNLRIENGVIAFCIALMIGATWFFFRRSSF